MLTKYLIAPSLSSLFITGLLLLLIIIIIVINLREISNFPLTKKLILLLLITITIGVHGLIHLGVEVNYKFNPYKWL